MVPRPASTNQRPATPPSLAATATVEPSGDQAGDHTPPSKNVSCRLGPPALGITWRFSRPEGPSVNATSVLLVAHNPGLTRLARDLCGYEGDLAPAEFASVELELDAWSELY